MAIIGCIPYYQSYDIFIFMTAGLRPKKCINIENQRFGRLVAIKKIERKDSYKKYDARDSSAIWECVCDCGKIIQTRRKLLRTGRSKSCGCLAISESKRVQKSRRPVGTISAVKKKWNTYRYNAKKEIFVGI